jgi:AsmA protein
VDRLVIAGPVHVSNVRVAGFDVGGKLGALPSLAGLSGAPKTGDTLVQTLAATLRIASGGIQASSVNVVVPAIGSLTGSGTISASGDVDFAMRAKLTGSGVVGEISRVVSLGQPADGIPFRIRGTTANPVFVPDVGGAVGGALGGLIASPDAAGTAASALSRLLGVKKR